VQHQHRETHHACQQREGLQQIEEAARIGRAHHGIEMIRHAQEEIAEGDAEQQRRHRAGESQCRIPQVPPARIGDLAAEIETHRPQDEREQDQEHGQIQIREGGRIQQRPGCKYRATAEDEPDLVALPYRFDAFEQRAPFLIIAADEAKRRAYAQVEAVHDGKADQERAQQRPPDHSQRLVVRHAGSLDPANSQTHPVRAAPCAP